MIARNRIYPGAVVSLLYPHAKQPRTNVQIVEILLLNGTKAMIYCRFYANGEVGHDILGPYSFQDFE